MPTEIDVEAVDLFLSLGFVPGPRTILRARQEAAAWTSARRRAAERAGRAVLAVPRAGAGRRHVADEEWEAQLLELLDDAVALQLMSDVPLGAMLSGGLDSSLIVALMARRMNRL